MAKDVTHNKIDLKYILIILIVVFLSTLFHELAHWCTGEILGNKMTASLNSVNLVSGEYKNEWNRNVVTAAGPLFTILQAIVTYILLNKYPKKELYPFLLFTLVMRFWAGLANLLGPNDEGRLGLSFGIGLLTISFIVCSFLFFLIYKSSKKHHFGLKFNLISFLLCSLFLIALSFINEYFKIKII
ncbi:hypothetical protein SOM12_23435 [Flavobacterium sp. CFBP9031]|jgi:hypothetical protein|uniref:hypothetical protein n=1 Tax=Flavobacterium sp. CFBP9031 TaxID=3096538 RepID=UPI002A6B191A|nr:hypothetical protein [Flavobacterium sp. CFBP9031]MDY0990401.1 hypothetical protein [Flavobacterium sp. CFBP9031]